MKKTRAKKRRTSNAEHRTPNIEKRAKPVWISGVTRMARAIAAEFKTTCSKQDINFWRGQEPRFPAPRDNGEFNRDECFDYFKKHVLPKRQAVGGVEGLSGEDIFMRAAKAAAEETIRDNETSKFQFDKLHGMYVERTVAERTIVGALKKLDGFYRAACERFGPAARKQKLQLLGVPAEIVMAFGGWDLGTARSLVDEARAACQAVVSTESPTPTGTSGQVSNSKIAKETK